MKYEELATIFRHCDGEVRAALEGDVPMDYELFLSCIDCLTEIGALETALGLAAEYPEFTERHEQELEQLEKEVEDDERWKSVDMETFYRRLLAREAEKQAERQMSTTNA